jgi:hypothetical protein
LKQEQIVQKYQIYAEFFCESQLIQRK